MPASLFRLLLPAAICCLILAPVPALSAVAEKGLPPSPRSNSGLILLDPGHSPAHPGAMSCTGRAEHLYNTELADVVKRHLVRNGFSVDLTRGPKEDISLMARAKLAKGHRLFLALHHDSAQPQFTGKTEAGHPVTDKPEAEGYSIFVSQKNRYYEESLAFARDLGSQLRKAGMIPSTHHGEPIKGENRDLLEPELGIYRFDDLVVLKHAESPAVLLESAVIIHPDDEARARSEAHRQEIAGAVYNALLFALDRDATRLLNAGKSVGDAARLSGAPLERVRYIAAGLLNGGASAEQAAQTDGRPLRTVQGLEAAPRRPEPDSVQEAPAPAPGAPAARRNAPSSPPRR